MHSPQALEYKDQVSFILVYVVEPHPMAPDISPYRGKVWTFKYSNRHQARDYAERVANAKLAQANTVGQLILVDDLTPHNSTAGNDPVWCTYGPNPNGAWLLDSDGKVDTAQTWIDPTSIGTAIQKLLGLSTKSVERHECPPCWTGKKCELAQGNCTA